jgi:hypothetical protein
MFDAAVSAQGAATRTIAVPGGLKPTSVRTVYELTVFLYIVSGPQTSARLASHTIDAIPIRSGSIIDVVNNDEASSNFGAFGSGESRTAMGAMVGVAVIVGLLAILAIAALKRRERAERQKAISEEGTHNNNPSMSSVSRPPARADRARGDTYQWDDTMLSQHSDNKDYWPPQGGATPRAPRGSIPLNAPRAFLPTRQTGLISRFTDESVWDWDAGSAAASAEMWESLTQETETHETWSADNPERGFAEMIGDRLMEERHFEDFDDYLESSPHM